MPKKILPEFVRPMLAESGLSADEVRSLLYGVAEL
jgi:hypothetical protein